MYQFCTSSRRIKENLGMLSERKSYFLGTAVGVIVEFLASRSSIRGTTVEAL